MLMDLLTQVGMTYSLLLIPVNGHYLHTLSPVVGAVAKYRAVGKIN